MSRNRTYKSQAWLEILEIGILFGGENPPIFCLKFDKTNKFRYYNCMSNTVKENEDKWFQELTEESIRNKTTDRLRNLKKKIMPKVLNLRRYDLAGHEWCNGCCAYHKSEGHKREDVSSCQNEYDKYQKILNIVIQELNSREKT